MMKDYPWQTRGVVLTAPMIRDVGLFCDFVERELAGHIDLIALQIRYRYRFASHPECMGCEPLSGEEVRRIADACSRAGIRLIPKMNLLGHQSGRHNLPSDGILHGAPGTVADTEDDGLLRAYPEFDEACGANDALYSRSLCPSHPGVLPVVCDLMDELLDVFGADAIHVGCDEAFGLCACPRCRNRSPADVFAGWINALGDHVRSRGAELMFWSDRLLDAASTGYGMYEASANETAPAIDIVDRRTVCCDWHYEDRSAFSPAYPSVDLFAEKGYRMFISPWDRPANAAAFVRYAREHDRGHIRGVLETTWCNSGELAGYMMYGRKYAWPRIPGIAETLRMLFW